MWQLAYAGAVGSQAMLGLARLERLRRGALKDRIAIWPFDTGFARRLDAPAVIAEIYPSLFAVAPAPNEPKDRAQVRAVARRFAALDRAGAFAGLLARPAALGSREAKAALEEEGWIVGVCAPHGGLYADHRRPV